MSAEAEVLAVEADDGPQRLAGRGLISGVAEIKTEIVRRTQATAIERAVGHTPMERDLTPLSTIGVEVITGALLFDDGLGGDGSEMRTVAPGDLPAVKADGAVQVLVLGGSLLTEGVKRGEEENVYAAFVFTPSMADHLLGAILKMRSDHHDLTCECEPEPEPAPGTGGYL